MHDIEILATKVVNSLYQVHTTLGPGLLESVYVEALTHELASSNILFKTEIEIPVLYKTTLLKTKFRADMIIENSIIIESKSIESLQPIHFAQLMNYMKLTKIYLGFLVNFNSTRFKSAIHRIKI